MVRTKESRFPPSPNVDKATVSFNKLNNTDLFLPIHGVYIVNTRTLKVHTRLTGPTRYNNHFPTQQPQHLRPTGPTLRWHGSAHPGPNQGRHAPPNFVGRPLPAGKDHIGPRGQEHPAGHPEGQAGARTPFSTPVDKRYTTVTNRSPF